MSTLAKRRKLKRARSSNSTSAPETRSPDFHRAPSTVDTVYFSTTELVQNLRTSLPLLIADLLAVACSWSIAKVLCYMIVGHAGVPGIRALAGLSAAVPVTFFLLGLYPGLMQHPAEELKRIFCGAAIAFIGLVIASFVIRNHVLLHAVDRTLHLGMLVVALAVFRFGARSWLKSQSWWRHPVAISGSKEEVASIQSWLDDKFYTGLRLQKSGESSPSHAIVAMDSRQSREIRDSLIWSYPTISEVSLVGSEPVVTRTVHNYLLKPWHRGIKRLFDLAVILALSPVILPITLVIAVLIRAKSPGPILFSQKRIGKNGEHFNAWKFRTMAVDAEAVLAKCLDENPAMRAEWEITNKLRNDPRITELGKYLRKTSLDELPQLLNVLFGEMSLVGPRPIPVYEKQKYGDVDAYYSRVSPGITGLWQVSGRNNTTYEKKLSYDSHYVQNWSIWLDFYLLLRTVKTVFMCEGAY